MRIGSGDALGRVMLNLKLERPTTRHAASASQEAQPLEGDVGTGRGPGPRAGDRVTLLCPRVPAGSAGGDAPRSGGTIRLSDRRLRSRRLAVAGRHRGRANPRPNTAREAGRRARGIDAAAARRLVERSPRVGIVGAGGALARAPLRAPGGDARGRLLGPPRLRAARPSRARAPPRDPRARARDAIAPLGRVRERPRRGPSGRRPRRVPAPVRPPAGSNDPAARRPRRGSERASVRRSTPHGSNEPGAPTRRWWRRASSARASILRPPAIRSARGRASGSPKRATTATMTSGAPSPALSASTPSCEARPTRRTRSPGSSRRRRLSGIAPRLASWRATCRPPSSSWRRASSENTLQHPTMAPSRRCSPSSSAGATRRQRAPRPSDCSPPGRATPSAERPARFACSCAT